MNTKGKITLIVLAAVCSLVTFLPKPKELFEDFKASNSYYTYTANLVESYVDETTWSQANVTRTLNNMICNINYHANYVTDGIDMTDFLQNETTITTPSVSDDTVTILSEPTYFAHETESNAIICYKRDKDGKFYRTMMSPYEAIEEELLVDLSNLQLDKQLNPLRYKVYQTLGGHYYDGYINISPFGKPQTLVLTCEDARPESEFKQAKLVYNFLDFYEHPVPSELLSGQAELNTHISIVSSDAVEDDTNNESDPRNIRFIETDTELSEYAALCPLTYSYVPYNISIDSKDYELVQGITIKLKHLKNLSVSINNPVLIDTVRNIKYPVTYEDGFFTAHIWINNESNVLVINNADLAFNYSYTDSIPSELFMTSYPAKQSLVYDETVTTECGLGATYKHLSVYGHESRGVEPHPYVERHYSGSSGPDRMNRENEIYRSIFTENAANVIFKGNYDEYSLEALGSIEELRDAQLSLVDPRMDAYRKLYMPVIDKVYSYYGIDVWDFDRYYGEEGIYLAYNTQEHYLLKLQILEMEDTVQFTFDVFGLDYSLDDSIEYLPWNEYEVADLEEIAQDLREENTAEVSEDGDDDDAEEAEEAEDEADESEEADSNGVIKFNDEFNYGDVEDELYYNSGDTE